MTFDSYTIADVMELMGYPECDATNEGRNNEWGFSITEDGTVTINPNGIHALVKDIYLAEAMVNLMHVSVTLRIQHALMKVLLKSEDIEDAAQMIKNDEAGTLLTCMLNYTTQETPARETLPEYLPPRLMAVLTRIVQIIRGEPRKPRGNSE